MIIIELDSVSMIYPGSAASAVSDISFQIKKGEVLALLGPSGSGKTTILRLIAGFENPDQGLVLLEGRDVCRSGDCLLPEKRGIGMVFQDYALFPHLSVTGNIAFGLTKMSRVDRAKKVNEIIDMVGLKSFRDRYPHELSGGQQQRVALARALAPDPIVVLLDEPFSNLDPDMRTEMRQEVSAILKKTGSTAVLVTHDHDEAFAMADQIVLLNRGRLEQYGSPEAIYHTPLTPFVADFVGQADFIAGRVQGETIVTVIGDLENKARFANHTEVMVMIRPDDIDLLPSETGKTTILARQFRGSENLYTLVLPSGEIVHSSQHSLAVYAEQTKVDLRLKLTHTVVFEKSEVTQEIEHKDGNI